MSVSLTNETKTTAVSLAIDLKHGKALLMSDLASKTFNDPAFADDTTPIKNLTFNQLGDSSLSLESKNSVSLTNENKT